MHKVLKQTEASGADSIFISDLAEVAWILNLRSSDVGCTPAQLCLPTRQKSPPKSMPTLQESA